MCTMRWNRPVLWILPNIRSPYMSIPKNRSIPKKKARNSAAKQSFRSRMAAAPRRLPTSCVLLPLRHPNPKTPGLRCPGKPRQKLPYPLPALRTYQPRRASRSSRTRFLHPNAHQSENLSYWKPERVSIRSNFSSRASAKAFSIRRGRRFRPRPGAAIPNSCSRLSPIKVLSSFLTILSFPSPMSTGFPPPLRRVLSRFKIAPTRCLCMSFLRPRFGISP